MFIFVDESGTFTESQNPDSWCVVAAYTLPENQIPHVARLLKRLKAKYGGTETKLAQMREADYFEVLDKLSALAGLGFAVACDVSLQSRDLVETHRDVQATKVLQHVDKMRYEAGRRGLQKMADDLRALPFQLYAQLVLQVLLFDEVLRRAPLYYAQRRPQTLANLRWRLDRKDTTPTAYEDAFRRLLPGLLQSRSLGNPMVMLSDGADYSYLKRFDFDEGKLPGYLEQEYGIKVKDGANVGMMVCEDFELVDSAVVDGVQVADMLASGVRRLLRGGFTNPQVAARLLGANLVGPIYKIPPITLATMGRESQISERNAMLLQAMAGRAKPLLRS